MTFDQYYQEALTRVRNEFYFRQFYEKKWDQNCYVVDWMYDKRLII